MTDIERMAAIAAEHVNGGKFHDGDFYSPEHRQRWIEAMTLATERLRAETVALRQSLEEERDALRANNDENAALEARLAEAEALLHRVYFASRIDVLMEGPRLQGWIRPELDRLWPDLRDLVAKLEQKP